MIKIEMKPLGDKKGNSLCGLQDVRVFADNGSELSKYVRSINVRAAFDELVVATISLFPSEVLVDNAVVNYYMIDPGSNIEKKIKSIQFDDNSEWKMK